MVANGEIYNHESLRAELGGAFATDSDSEVVLRVLETRGTDGVHDLRGMYAFCTATGDGDVVLARDPLGVKPLYWARHEDRVLAASELGAFPPELRPLVEEFPPGHHWTPGQGLRAVRRPAHRPARPGRTRRAAVPGPGAGAGRRPGDAGARRAASG